MAGSEECVAPLGERVSLIVQRRVRALRKKVRNVEEIEKKVREGKSVNEQQEEAIRNKNVTLLLLEEVERLKKAIEAEEALERKAETDTKKAKEEDSAAKSKLAAEAEAEAARKVAEAERRLEAEREKAVEAAARGAKESVDAAVEKLLKVLYFGRLFDTSTGNTLAHYERAAYLGYDGLLKGSSSVGMIKQKHLDGIAAFAYYLSSRPMNQLVSHKQALDQCIALAKEFVAGGKAKKMEVPLSDGTMCDLEAMMERISLTGFYSIVPTLQSFEDFNSLSAMPVATETTTTNAAATKDQDVAPAVDLGRDQFAVQDAVRAEEVPKAHPAAVAAAATEQQQQQPQRTSWEEPLLAQNVAAPKDAFAGGSKEAEKEKRPHQRQKRQAKARGGKQHRQQQHQQQGQAGHGAPVPPALTEMDSNQHIFVGGGGTQKKGSANASGAHKQRGGDRGGFRRPNNHVAGENGGKPKTSNGKFSGGRQRRSAGNKAGNGHHHPTNGNGRIQKSHVELVK